MPQLINLETQKPEDVGHDDVKPALDSGKYDLPTQGTLNVLNPDGKLVSIPNDQAYDAINQYGYRLPSSGQVNEFQNQQKYGEGGDKEAKAFLAGAARSASFGLSDVGLTETGLVKPETLEGLKKYNPTATTLGEVSGIAGSLLALPEAGLVGGVGRVAEGLSEAAAPIASSAAKLLANPETAPLASKALQSLGRVSAKATGAALEGAAYGVGQSISEKALGEPDLNAEKVLSNIGISAAFGGALGAGLQGLKETGLIKAPKFLSEIDKKSLDEGSIEPAIANSEKLSDSEKSNLLKGVTQLKPNVNEIRNAAMDLGAPVLPGQISANKGVQKFQDMLLQGSPTWASLRQQKLASEGYGKARDALGGILGETQMSKAELGESLRKSLTEKIEQMNAPVNDLYNEINKEFKQIPLESQKVSDLIDTLKSNDIARIAPSSPAAKLIRNVSKDVEGLKTVNDIKAYKTSLRGRLSNISSNEEKRASGFIMDTLSDLENNSIVDYAKNLKDISPIESSQKIQSLLEARQGADEYYRVFKEKLQTLAKAFGKEKAAAGTDTFINFLHDDLTVEKLADRFFAKNDSNLLKTFSRDFPEEMEKVAQYQKGLIGDAAIKDGQLNVKSAIKNINKLPEETKSVMFKPEELQKIRSVDTYVGSFPESYNPSGTHSGSTLSDFFKHPIASTIGSTISNIKDFGIEKYIKSATEGGDQASRTGAVLSHINDLIQKSSDTIQSGVKQVFKKTDGRPVEPFLGYISSKITDNKYHEKFDNKTKNLTDLMNNPQKLMDKLTGTTEAIYAHAPDHAQSINTTLSTAVSFLTSKLPTDPNKALLSPNYKPSTAEMANFERYYHSVENPLSILKSVKQGTLTPQALEAVKTVYPKLYGEMSQKIMEELNSMMSKKKVEIPYSTKMSLSMFLGQDLDNSLSQQNMMLNRASMAKIASKNQANQDAVMNPVRTTAKGLSNITSSSRIETNTQSNAHRES